MATLANANTLENANKMLVEIARQRSAIDNIFHRAYQALRKNAVGKTEQEFEAALADQEHDERGLHHDRRLYIAVEADRKEDIAYLDAAEKVSGCRAPGPRTAAS